MPQMQEVDLNDAAWSEVVSTRLPAHLEVQARQLKAWIRQRGLASVHGCVAKMIADLYTWG